ncbi:MAG: nucleotide pyrophosphatase [Ruminococcaceae bacterium]|nr:nucleotide pyrophosphatase [Oscillospiraceae bacterium]
MKKILSMILVLVMLTTLFASCSNDQNKAESKNNESINDQTESDTTLEDTESETEEDTEESETEIEEPVVLEPPYKRVVLIGVDGAGAFFKKAETPNIDRIFENGAVTYDAVTATPSVSAQCWGSLLHGVPADIHRLTFSIIDNYPYGTVSRIPSIFQVVRDNDSEALLASIVNWIPINRGVVEDGIGIHKDTGDDQQVTDKVCKYLKEHDPKLLFVHFDSVDGAGHNDGYGSNDHLKQIKVIDGYIGLIYSVLENRGMLDDTLFIVTTDHGGTPDGTHGEDTDAEMKIMYAAVGHSVQKGGKIGEMSIWDNAAVIAYALGYEAPEKWTSKIPNGLFQEIE